LPSPLGVQPFERCCERRIRAVGIASPDCDRPFASVWISTEWKTLRCILSGVVVGLENILWRGGQVGGSCGAKSAARLDQHDRLHPVDNHDRISRCRFSCPSSTLIAAFLDTFLGWALEWVNRCVPHSVALALLSHPVAIYEGWFGCLL